MTRTSFEIRRTGGTRQGVVQVPKQPQVTYRRVLQGRTRTISVLATTF
jgi:hypothetical protein